MVFKNILKTITALVLITSIFYLVKTAYAQTSTYYVNSTGNDGNPGSQSSPWKTIQKAANSAASGSTVIVAAGNYPENVHVTRSGIAFEAQGTVTTHGITITGDSTGIKGFEITSNGADGHPGIDVSANACDLENNYIHDTSREGIVTEGLPSNPTASQNCVIKNNRIYHAEMAGMDIAGVNHLVEGNEIWGTMQYGPLWPNPPDYVDADGFRFFGSGHIFRGNYIHDIKYDATINRDPHTDCFQTFNGGGDHVTGHDILFENNFCDLPFDGPGLRAKAWQVESNAYNLTMKNNVVYTNLASLFNGAHDITFLNNTFVGTLGDDAQGIHFTNALNVVAKNNIFADMENGVSQLFNEGGSTITASNNCIYKVGGNRHDPGDVNGQDPLFVNQDANDYHLQSNSPCIDKGANVGVNTDKDGNSRPQGAGYDIGAYEYSSGVPSATPSPTPLPTPTASPTPTVKPGDANGDNKVDGDDFTIWLAHYRQSVSGIESGDFNNSGKVDGVDYVIWLNGYGK